MVRLCTSTAGDTGLIPVGELRSCMLRGAAKKKRFHKEMPNILQSASSCNSNFFLIRARYKCIKGDTTVFLTKPGKILSLIKYRMSS